MIRNLERVFKCHIRVVLKVSCSNIWGNPKLSIQKTFPNVARKLQNPIIMGSFTCNQTHVIIEYQNRITDQPWLKFAASRFLTTSTAALSVPTPAWTRGWSWGFPSRADKTSTSFSVPNKTGCLHRASSLWPFTSWYTPAKVARGPEDTHDNAAG